MQTRIENGGHPPHRVRPLLGSREWDYFLFVCFCDCRLRDLLEPSLMRLLFMVCLHHTNSICLYVCVFVFKGCSVVKAYTGNSKSCFG